VLGVGVYVVSHPNPGHTAFEIEGVCRSDGTNCFANENFQQNLNMYIDSSDRICYPSSTSSGCNLQSEICTVASNYTISGTVPGITCPSQSDLISMCQAACESVIACSGDTTGI